MNATQAANRVDPDPLKYRALASYFEDENVEDAAGAGTACGAAPYAPAVFCRALRASNFNDKVVLVAP